MPQRSFSGTRWADWITMRPCQLTAFAICSMRSATLSAMFLMSLKNATLGLPIVVFPGILSIGNLRVAY